MTTVCFDASNLAIRNLFGPEVLTFDPNDKNKVVETNYDLLKYRFFDSVYKSLFKVPNVREVVLAMDDRRSWRKLYWPKYKANRKSGRERIDLDWDEYYAMYDEFMMEIKENIPFKVIKAKDTEADDIIGGLTLHYPQDFYIISTDKDFLQLSSSRVKIYNPTKKVHVDHPNPELFLVQECFCGQTKDNIWNIKTPLNWEETQAFVDGKKKPGFGEKTFEKVLTKAGGWKQWLEDNELTERYEFNRNLMDFSRIPTEIKKRISREYDGYTMPNPDNIYSFIEKKRWPEYIDNFTNIENKLMELY